MTDRKHYRPDPEAPAHDITPPAEPAHPEHEQHDDHGGMNGMVGMMKKNHRAHLAPAPGAEHPPVDPFPGVLFWGVAAGVLLGLVLGWIVGGMLLKGTIVVPGWEQLYSMTPGTFKTFWAGIGAAAGIIVVGIPIVLLAPMRKQD